MRIDASEVNKWPENSIFVFTLVMFCIITPLHYILIRLNHAFATIFSYLITEVLWHTDGRNNRTFCNIGLPEVYEHKHSNKESSTT